MSPILERNVRALLRRSYVPALPAPQFRDQLEALFLREVERRRRRPRPVQPARDGGRAPALRLALALAAGIAALFLGWRVFSRSAASPREELLRRGAVALGFPDGSWRAASERELAAGVEYAGPGLVAATPRSEALTLLFPDTAAGSLRLHEESALELVTRNAAVEAELLYGRASWIDSEGSRALEPGLPRALPRAEPASAAAVAGQEAERDPERAVASSRESVAPSAPAPAPEPDFALRGRVRVAATGEPVERFTVALLAERAGNETPPPIVREFGAVDGAFRWKNPPAGKQRIFVHAEGFALAVLGEHELAPDRVPALLEVGLVPGGTLRGLVLDPEGNPVPDALVLSETDAPTDGLLMEHSEHAFWLPIRTRSGPDGRFELAHLRARMHTLRVSAAGRAPSWVFGREVAEGPGAPPGEDVVVELGFGGTVRGSVSDAHGAPSAGVDVVIVPMDLPPRPCTSFALARTDAQGLYEVAHLPACTLIVVLARDDDRPEVKPVRLSAGETVSVDFAVARSGTRLRGHLLDSRGAPFALQNVGLFDRLKSNWDQNWVASTTTQDGGFQFEGVVPGPYSLFLIDEMGDGLRCVDEFDVPDWPEFARDVRLAGHSLAVRVRDERTGAPVGDASLILLREGAATGEGFSFSGHGRSDAQGRCDYRDLRPGTYVVWVYPSSPGLGYGVGAPVILDAARPGATLEVALPEGGPVVVRVTDAEGRPLPGALVTFVDEAGDEHAFARLPSTDEEGLHRAVGVRAGTYRVWARLPGQRGEPATFQHELGQPAEVTVRLVPASPK